MQTSRNISSKKAKQQTTWQNLNQIFHFSCSLAKKLCIFTNQAFWLGTKPTIMEFFMMIFLAEKVESYYMSHVKRKPVLCLIQTTMA